jgi:hypothetical protein
VLFFLRLKLQLINEFECIAQAVATLKFIFDFAEYLPDLVFNRVGALGALLEALQIWKQLSVDVRDESNALRIDPPLSSATSPTIRAAEMKDAGLSPGVFHP